MGCWKLISAVLSYCVLYATVFRRNHSDVIKWKHFPLYWSFVRRIYGSPVDSPYKGKLRGALMFSLIYASTNGWANDQGAGDARRHRTCYDVTVMKQFSAYWHACCDAILVMNNHIHHKRPSSPKITNNFNFIEPTHSYIGPQRHS